MVRQFSLKNNKGQSYNLLDKRRVMFFDPNGLGYEEDTDYLRIGSLEEYGRYFYTTDHHWNYRGSYAGYCQIVRMLLGEDEPVIEPAETVTFPVKFPSLRKTGRLFRQRWMSKQPNCKGSWASCSH